MLKKILRTVGQWFWPAIAGIVPGAVIATVIGAVWAVVHFLLDIREPFTWMRTVEDYVPIAIGIALAAWIARWVKKKEYRGPRRAPNV